MQYMTHIKMTVKLRINITIPYHISVLPKQILDQTVVVPKIIGTKLLTRI